MSNATVTGGTGWTQTLDTSTRVVSTSPVATSIIGLPAVILPWARTAPRPSTNCGRGVSGIRHGVSPVLVSDTSAIRLPAAPSQAVIRAARFAGSHGPVVGAGGLDAAATAEATGVGVWTADGLALSEPRLPTSPGDAIRPPSQPTATTRAAATSAAPTRPSVDPRPASPRRRGALTGRRAILATASHSSRIRSVLRFGSITRSPTSSGRG